MKRYKKYLSAFIFLLVAMMLITFASLNPLMVTTQDVGSQTGYRIQEISRGFVSTQEITMKKDYLTGIGLFFTTNKRINTNDNLLLILDNHYRVIHRETLSSKDIKDYKYYPINLKRSVYIGKGNTIYLCHYSDNGDENNHVSVICKPYSTLGKLYVSPVTGNDILVAVAKKTKDYPGSFVLKTYESKFNTSLLIRLILYLFAVGIALCVIFSKSVFSAVNKLILIPEKIFLLFSVVFGLILIFLTPPLQVPDEQSHFNRAYQVSELNFFRSQQTVPRSLVLLDSIFEPMKFNSDVKTSVREILALTDIRLNPEIREPKGTMTYIIPYIPSAIGIFAGRILNFPPVILLYLGRLFNLAFSILLLYFAIKIVPVHKWVFLLLSLMPMALFMRVSLSYDVAKTGLSFLLLALLLKFAFNEKSSLTSRNIVLLMTVIILLALSKVPWLIAGLMFLLIPVKKAGSVKKYVLLFLSLMVLPAVAIKLFSFGETYLGPQQAILGEQPYRWATALVPNNTDIQISYILGNMTDFLGIVFKTIFVYRGESYISEFIGNLGWLDAPLPSFMIVLFLTMLFITAIGDSTYGINPGWKWKIVPLVCFIMAVFVIETIYFISGSATNRISVEGIQGRYFITYAPLFFLIFYNAYISGKLNTAFSLKNDELLRMKTREKSDLITYIQKNEQIFSKILHLFIVCFIVFTLSVTVYTLAHRYYYLGESTESVEARKITEKESQLKIKKAEENQQVENRCFNLAKAAFTAGNLDSAACYLEQVIALNAKNSEAANNLAFLYLQQNNKNKATQVVEKMKANGMEINKNLLNLLK